MQCDPESVFLYVNTCNEAYGFVWDSGEERLMWGCRSHIYPCIFVHGYVAHLVTHSYFA